MLSINKNITRAALYKFGVSFSVAVLFLMTRAIQANFLHVFSMGPRASFFYLPAAVITLGALVSPFSALTGIFIGNLISNMVWQSYSSAGDRVIVSLVPVLAAAAALCLTAFFNPRFREFHQPHDRFSQIDAIDIFYFCCLYAIINVSILKLLFYYEIEQPVAFPPIMVFGMAFGDLTGSFLVFIFLNLMFSLYIRFR